MGAIVSVNDNPFHLLCCKVKNTYCSLPGKFTMIIAAMVKPRRASKEISRLDGRDIQKLGAKGFIFPGLTDGYMYHLAFP